MKNSKECLKCQSKKIIKIDGGSTFGWRRNLIPVSSGFKQIPVTRFVCEECGYSEEWIESQQDIKQLKREFK